MSFTALRPSRSAESGTAEDVDVGIAAEAGQARNDPAVRALGTLSDIADQVPSMVICGSLLAYGLATRRDRVAEAGAGMLASVLVAALVKSGVKRLVSRTRPFAVLDGDAYEFEVGGRDGPMNHSFPSGHTAGAVAAARGLTRVYAAARGPAYATAAAIALVQLPRAKHYPADLAAGAVIGITSEALVAAATHLVRTRMADDARRSDSLRRSMPDQLDVPRGGRRRPSTARPSAATA